MVERRNTVRVNVTARWLLKREMAWEEITFVPLVWMPAILSSFTYGAAVGNSQQTAAYSSQLMLSVALFGIGSWLNTFSELQRKWWKARPENKVST